jgi:hypothetical protein
MLPTPGSIADVYNKAFERLPPATQMWIRQKALQIVSAGQFGSCQRKALEDEVRSRFGSSALSGNPSIADLVWYFASQGRAQQPSSAGDDAQLANLDLQNQILRMNQQQQLFQTMSNVSRLMHDTAMSAIRNLR